MDTIKKSLILAAALIPMLVGCRVNERAFDGTTVYGDVAAEYATWQSGDSIGVSGLYNGNNLFVVTNETSGTKNGTFKGQISSAPVTAYYPYSITVSTTEQESVSLTLPSAQVSGTKPDLSLDVRVCSKPDGSNDEGYTFKFTHKLALMEISIIPDGELQDVVLTNLGLEVPGCILAGDYKMSLTNATKELTFSKKYDSVEAALSQTPKLKQGEAVTAWMFVNADIAKEDSMIVTLYSEDSTIEARITAPATVEAGVCNKISLDIATLRAAGKIHDVSGEGTVFTDITKCGIYNLSKKVISAILDYKEGVDQYTIAYNNTYYYYSVVNVNNGYATKISFPKKDLIVGNTFNLKSISVGISLPDDYYDAKLVKVSNTTYWFKDETDNLGFILSTK